MFEQVKFVVIQDMLFLAHESEMSSSKVLDFSIDVIEKILWLRSPIM